MTTATQSKRAVLVDQHPLWLEAVEQEVSKDGIAVVGKAATLAEAAELLEGLQPDLAIVEAEIQERETDGLAWSAAIKKRFPELRVIVLSASNHPADIRRALDGGASAYVIKKAHPDDLRVAVRQAYARSVFFPAPHSGDPSSAGDGLALSSGLTPREVAVLRFTAEGLTNCQIAERLLVTEQTVKYHLSNIYRKIGVSNRTGATRWAELHGLLPPPREERGGASSQHVPDPPGSASRP